MNVFINTAAPDIAKARTVGLNQLTAIPFPVVTVGSIPTLSAFFANRGVSETWSGDPTYVLRATIGDAFIGPIGGTWTVTVGSGAAKTLPFDIDSAGLQKALTELNRKHPAPPPDYSDAAVIQ